MVDKVIKITTPTDPYDPAWQVWNAQNPGVYKSVGAAAATEGGEDESGEEKPVTKPGKRSDRETSTPTDAARLAALETELASARQSADEAKRAAEDAAARLAAFDGVDPVEAKRLLKEKQEAELAAAEARGEFDRVKAAMVEAHQVELSAKDSAISTLQGQLTSLQAQIDELTVGRSFSDSAFIRDELVLTPAKTRTLYGAHFEIEGGALVGYDKPKGASDRTPLVDARGNKLGFEDALRRLIDADPDKERLLKSKLAAGAGSGTQEKAPAPTKQVELHGMSRIAAALSKQKSK
ncbi:DUF6651 domain-containing protein [Magnetospirillum molischianum]|uniref:DUF6651 domain-containing protein n=1 Tax=Magnetospirillum molischianum DSM 120 TaxID=1150626 RepID=H8FY45_MAGML|nr:DUF6651 domain-containing protein [Magnetospirillum molischianum]CCG43283.1 conserved hypothetical protein [Magnetospirillum molischianum DSM 120]